MNTIHPSKDEEPVHSDLGKSMNETSPVMKKVGKQLITQ